MERAQACPVHAEGEVADYFARCRPVPRRQRLTAWNRGVVAQRCCRGTSAERGTAVERAHVLKQSDPLPL